jgi:ferredoxin
MKIILDKEKCLGCGTCVALCPECFKMGEDQRASVKKEWADCAEKAAQACPSQAIKAI